MRYISKLLAFLLLFGGVALADCEYVDYSATSNIIRVKIVSSATGNGLTGLTSASSGLKIGTIANNEATSTAYTVAGSTIESITTLGTYAAPTATKVRFKEVDATNHPGLYEIQLADARFAVANAKSLIISASGATNMVDMDCHIPLMSTKQDFANTLLATTISELSSMPSAASPTVSNILRWLYQYGTGYYKTLTTSTTKTLKKDDGTTSLGTCTVSDDGTTFTRGECS